MMYKILTNNSIKKISDSISIPLDSNNRHYQEFIEDIYTHGLEIVEGADYVGVTTYTEARAAEYPPIKDQLDKIYHEGIDAWKAEIKVIKNKYPKTQVGITSIAPLPDWVNTALFEKQKEKYVEAVARLAKYELSAGLRDTDRDTYIIEPLPIVVTNESGGDERNPLIVQDEKEREAAQEIVNNTPQAVIDSINT